jgi:streptogramin lyase
VADKARYRLILTALGMAVVVTIAAVACNMTKSPPATAPSPPSTTPSAPATTKPPSESQAVLPLPGLKEPVGVAVDAGGAVYVIDSGDGRVLRLAAGATTATELRFPLSSHPWGVAVDAGGAVYVAYEWANRVFRLAAGAAAADELPFPGLHNPQGVGSTLAALSTSSTWVTNGWSRCGSTDRRANPARSTFARRCLRRCRVGTL